MSLNLSSTLIAWVTLAPHVLSIWFYLIILNVPIGILLGFSSGITGSSLNFDIKSWKNPKVSSHAISLFCIRLCSEYDLQISGSNSPGVSSYCIENPMGVSCHFACYQLMSCKMWTLRKGGELFVYLVALHESPQLSPCLAPLTLLFYFSDCSTLLYWNILTGICTYMRAYVRMQCDVPSHYSRLVIPPGPSCFRGHEDFW